MKKDNWEVISRFYLNGTGETLVSPVMKTNQNHSNHVLSDDCHMYIDIFSTRKEARKFRRDILQAIREDL